MNGDAWTCPDCDFAMQSHVRYCPVCLTRKETSDEIGRLRLQRNALDHALRQRDKQCLQLMALIRDVHGGLLDERIATALQVQP
jgi:hypothetical protein